MSEDTKYINSDDELREPANAGLSCKEDEDRRKEGDRRKINDRRVINDRRKDADDYDDTGMPAGNRKNKVSVLLVDDTLTSLRIGKNILSDKYTVATAVSAEKMFRYLEKNRPAMILLDIDMPEMNGYEAIKVLKTQPNTKNIPVIFLTARTEAADELEGLSLGAVDYIIKPYHPSVLLKRIEIRLAG